MPYFTAAKQADTELHTESAIQKLIELQGAVYRAAWAIIDVETRDRGWRIEDAQAARGAFEIAKKAYKDTFGVDYEWEDKYTPGMAGMMPIEKPTQRRMIELCNHQQLN